jgi:hypothetical protein
MLRDSVTRFSTSGFFMNQFPQAPEYTIRAISNFFRSLILVPFFATGVNDAGVVDTGGKFAAGIVVTGGKFATGINNTSETGSKFANSVIDTGSAP